ncbi:hypothetical protein HN51_024847 [Arachis hypogaea]|uniref:Basic leucine zipper 34-like n=1 Tax=Arachis duranensis TaxID=130453 RepID=A0A6P5MHR9_ARADU|nr:basic leucine zipper 34-like [Arachis duranensis]XP_025607843.2 basic leucine zipper 34 [Arachis hypogaea]QHO27890.1 Basic leucine zipper [Arachis hypogaea]
MENTEMENNVVGATTGNERLSDQTNPKHYKNVHTIIGDCGHGDTNSSYPQFSKGISVCNPNMRNPNNGPDDQLVQFAELILGPNKFDPNMDPKKINKMISNRLSAQRSRQRKVRYLLNLEEQMKIFQEKVTILRTQITSYTNQKQLLMSEQTMLRQKLEAIEKEKSLRNAETEKKNAELKILKELRMKNELEELFGVPIFNWDAIRHPISSRPNLGQEKYNVDETSPEIMKVEMPPINEVVVLHANNMDFLAPSDGPAQPFGRE